jgi:hypothetical protein
MNKARDHKISGVCKDEDAFIMEVGTSKCKQNLEVIRARLFQLGTSEEEAEMLGTRKFSGTSAKSRSMPV